MSRLMLRVLLPSLFLCVLCSAQEEVESAVRLALAEGLPEVALVKVERAKRTITKPSPALLRLALECYVRAKQPRAALALAEKHSELTGADYWLGLAHLQEHEPDAALEAFEKVQVTDLQPYAELGAVEALRLKGLSTEARKRLTPLRSAPDAALARTARLLFNELELEKGRLDPVVRRLRSEDQGKDAEVQLLRARAQLQSGRPSAAEALLRDLLATDGVGERSHDATLLMLATVLKTSAPQKARSFLVRLIDSLPPQGPSPARHSDYLHDAFLLLQEIEAPSTQDTLLSSALGWSLAKEPVELPGYALELAAVILEKQNRNSEALGMLEAQLSLYPSHARREAVLRRAAELHGNLEHDERLLALAEQWKKEFGKGSDDTAMDRMVAAIRYSRQQYSQARDLFLSAAERDGELQHRRTALYNAAVSAIQAGDDANYRSTLVQLENTAGRAAATLDPAGLDLDRALLLAQKAAPEASEALQQFLTKHPAHDRWAEAQLALAELNLLETPPLVKGTREALEAAAARATDDQREQVDYLRVWLRQAEGDLMALTRDGLTFVERWQPRPRCAEVLMKVAEAFYRLEDYSNAQAQFAAVAEKYPESSFTETALFFAGKAALAVNTQQSLNEAITLWQTVAERAGTLAFPARFHQALAKRLQGAPAEAVRALNELTSDAKLTAEQKRLVAFEKAETLIGMTSTTPESAKEAEALLKLLLKEEGYEWRARASVLLATLYTESKRSSEALEAAWDAVQALHQRGNEPPTPAEYEWYSRAGFIALNLLEKNQQWESAAKLAERLALTKGHRAKEAAERATRIRLEHFLWDGNPVQKTAPAP